MAARRGGTQRWRLLAAALATTALTIALYGASPTLLPHAGAAPLANLTQYVNPFVGTDTVQPDFGVGGAGGNTFPGAAWPFGIVQWSPDTTPLRQDHAGGYTDSDRVIRGFSLTHLSGTGCPIYQDIPIMPLLAPPPLSPVVAGPAITRYTAPFTHADERAAPGYYAVQLASGSGVELSVTRRSGFGLFTYPATSTATLLVDNGGSANGNSATSIAITGPPRLRRACGLGRTLRIVGQRD